MRHVYVLVTRARRQEEIEERVWRGFLRLLLWSPVIFCLWLALCYWMTATDLGYGTLVSAVMPKKFFVVQTGYNRRQVSPPSRQLYREAVIERVEATGNGAISGELRSLGRSGAVALAWKVKDDGTLDGVFIMRSSGDKALDAFACRIVRQAAPFPPMPDEVRRSGRMVMNRWLAFDYADRGADQLFTAGIAPLNQNGALMPTFDACPAK